MKLSTLRQDGRTAVARQDGDTFVAIDGFRDVGDLLQQPDWQDIAARADGARRPVAGADLAPVVTSPGKIICVGANYRQHILEMGIDLPAYPTIFAKFADALVGAYDDIELPPEDASIDWEAELAIVIGRPGRRIAEADALSHVAGYAVLNDVSMRGYQFRTNQWLQGKTWEKSTPIGPALVTPDEFDGEAAIRTVIGGEVLQESTTADLLFGPKEIVAYLSTIITLRPGDIIATGTPGGVGVARTPQRFIRPGDVVETTIDGLGTLRNTAVAAV